MTHAPPQTTLTPPPPNHMKHAPPQTTLTPAPPNHMKHAPPPLILLCCTPFTLATLRSMAATTFTSHVARRAAAKPPSLSQNTALLKRWLAKPKARSAMSSALLYLSRAQSLAIRTMARRARQS